MYPQSAKIQLFGGIGKRSPAHVGSSEGEENDVGKLGCSVRRGFRINELLHCKASEQYRSELLFPNKTKRNKTKRENYESNYLNLLFHLGCKQRFVAVQSSGVRTGRRACLALRQRPLQPPDAGAFVPETSVVALVAKRVCLLHAEDEAVAIAIDKHLLEALHVARGQTLDPQASVPGPVRAL
jgi:hypothetical protein